MLNDEIGTKIFIYFKKISLAQFPLLWNLENVHMCVRINDTRYVCKLQQKLVNQNRYDRRM